MIRILYQVGNRRNSSPTLEVGVFLLEEDKCRIKTVQRTSQDPHSQYCCYGEH